jgi:hypothetical protein
MAAPQPVPDVARRSPVWQSLAELYLDTELQEYDLRRLAATFAASGFSWAQIQRINYDEVAPALLANLFGVTGEWAGWAPGWLHEQLSARYIGTRHRLLGSVRLWEWWVDRHTKEVLTQAARYVPGGLEQLGQKQP